MQIFYGIALNKIDVTDVCFQKLKRDDIITIPDSEALRAFYFSDPVFGTLKKIFILSNNVLTEYDHNLIIKIDVSSGSISTINIGERISKIHSELKIKHGSFNQELPEQKLAATYLSGNEKVLEIGGNLGRNSLVIANILSQQNNNNFVVLESDPNSTSKLIENRDYNNFTFHVEGSALSKRKLIQKGWDTIPSDVLLPEYNWVNTIDLENLKNKYNIQFDTLVLDCEGAFYYILVDMPEILENINLILVENDYKEVFQKNYVDEILKKNNFYLDYSEYCKEARWSIFQNEFFSVWRKR